MTAAAGLLAVTVSGCTRADIEDKIRFGWPHGVTEQAEKMRLMWSWSSVAALAVGVVVWGLTFWVCAFHRKRSEALPRQTALNLPLEIAYTIAPFIIIAVLFAYTAVIETDINKTSATPDATVKVIGFKWNWEFDYLDQRDHRVTPEMEARGVAPFVNTVGTADQIPVLVLPVGKKVRIEEEAEDVIHSFWVIDFLFKRDVIPGVTNRVDITPQDNGTYTARCAEFCGLDHAKMTFTVKVVSMADYNAWVTEQQARRNGPTT